MQLTKKIILIVAPCLSISALAVLGCLAFGNYKDGAIKRTTNVVLMHASYPADFSDDRVLVGESHNIFVAKIIRQIGERERGIGPETQFQATVIKNIKGDLQGNVVIDQSGGYRNGTLYILGDGDVVQRDSGDQYLLQP